MARHIHIYLHTHDDASLSALYADLVDRMWRCLQDARTSDSWEETKHPRAKDGRFGSKPGEHGTQSESNAAAGAGGKTALRALLETGQPFTKEALMSALGLTKEVTLKTYLSDLKNPKYAGAGGALNITQNKDGTFQVVKSDGTPAPVPEKKSDGAVTLVSERRVTGSMMEGSWVELTLSDGSKARIVRLNSTESMGLPGWHDADRTGNGRPSEQNSYLGDTKEDAIKELLRRRNEAKPQPKATPKPTPKPAAAPAPVDKDAERKAKNDAYVKKQADRFMQEVRADSRLNEFADTYGLAVSPLSIGGGIVTIVPPADRLRAYFGDAESSALTLAAKRAGLNVLPLRSSPMGVTSLSFAVPGEVEPLKAHGPWKPAATTKEVSQRAVSDGYVDAAEFGTMPVDRANELMASIADHMREFPALRQQGHWFTGTTAAWKKESVKTQVEIWSSVIQAERPDITPEQLAWNVKYRVRVPRGMPRAWAMAWMQNTAPGQKSLRAVSLNETFTKSPDMRNTLMHNVTTGWHPPGCDTLKSVMDHEMGHQLDYMLALRSNPKVVELIGEAKRADGGVKGSVSTYGAKNPAEFIAEAWAEARNSANPRPIAKKLEAIIKEAYAQKFKAA